jgi:hypothetical protein
MPPRIVPRAQPPAPQPPRTPPPALARPAAARPATAAGPPRPAPPRERQWYNEPAVIATVIVLVLVGVAFVILIKTAL